MDETLYFNDSLSGSFARIIVDDLLAALLTWRLVATGHDEIDVELAPLPTRLSTAVPASIRLEAKNDDGDYTGVIFFDDDTPTGAVIELDPTFISGRIALIRLIAVIRRTHGRVTRVTSSRDQLPL